MSNPYNKVVYCPHRAMDPNYSLRPTIHGLDFGNGNTLELCAECLDAITLAVLRREGIIGRPKPVRPR